ncbi:MAG: hypothetical protein NZM08_08800 [Chitinophagales bacterium]|nr:hypothetical protein [Chitinophagales bacterium]
MTRSLASVLLLLFASGRVLAACEAFFYYTVDGYQIHVDGSASAGNITVWKWFVNGILASTDGPQTTLTVSSNGTYKVCLVVKTSDNCSDDCCQYITVGTGGTSCEAVISYEIDGMKVWLDGSSSSSNLTGWQWFVDGNLFDDSGPFTDYTVPGPGTYEFCLVVWNADCCDTTCKTITVEESSGKPCEAVIKVETDGLNVYLNGSYSSSNITGWQWFVDGYLFDDTGPFTDYTVPGPGSYEFCLVVWNADCCDTTCKTITVEESGGKPCEAVIQHETDGLQVWLNGSFSSGDVTDWQWYLNGQWIALGATTDVLLPQSGTYEVCLIIFTADNCTDTACKEITVAELSGGSGMKTYYESGKLWLELQSPVAGAATIRLHAPDGRQWLSQHLSVQAGKNRIAIADGQLPVGVVFITVTLPEQKTPLRAVGMTLKN